jgi:hypothetical protein
MLLAAGFPTARLGFDPRPGYVGFVGEKVALGKVSSKYFGFPCQFSFHRLLRAHHHLSSGAGTIGQTVAVLSGGLSLTAPYEKYCDMSTHCWVTQNCWDVTSDTGHAAMTSHGTRTRGSCVYAVPCRAEPSRAAR